MALDLLGRPALVGGDQVDHLGRRPRPGHRRVTPDVHEHHRHQPLANLGPLLHALDLLGRDRLNGDPEAGESVFGSSLMEPVAMPAADFENLPELALSRSGVSSAELSLGEQQPRRKLTRRQAGRRKSSRRRVRAGAGRGDVTGRQRDPGPR